MTSCAVDETKDKVIVRYLNGKSYEYKGWSVDYCVDWYFNTLNLVQLTHVDEYASNDEYLYKKVFLTSDTMVVESWHSDSVTIWKNPKYKLSVKTDIMTAKQRAKRNQNIPLLESILFTLRKKDEFKTEEDYQELNQIVWGIRKCLTKLGVFNYEYWK